MDKRIELVNRISSLIISSSHNFNDICKKVNEFDEILEKVCRNYYEVKQEQEAPLFELCEYLKLGANNYYLSESEYNITIDKLKRKVNQKFDYDFINNLK